MRFQDWGLVEYEEALERQRAAFERVIEGGEGVVVFCEHPPVFTIGRNGNEANILTAEALLRERGAMGRNADGELAGRLSCSTACLGDSGVAGARVVRTDRGGDVTFHGPGQLVCYPILRLGTMGLREYIHRLEQAVIDTLAEFGIEGVRTEKGAGVWTADGKIAAVGVRASRGAVMHGLALNVTTDLRWFRMINPCGMAGEPVARMDAEMGEVKATLSRKLREWLMING